MKKIRNCIYVLFISRFQVLLQKLVVLKLPILSTEMDPNFPIMVNIRKKNSLRIRITVPGLLFWKNPENRYWVRSLNVRLFSFLILRIITLKVKCRWRCSQIAFIDRIIVNNCIEILTFFFLMEYVFYIFHINFWFAICWIVKFYFCVILKIVILLNWINTYYVIVISIFDFFKY